MKVYHIKAFSKNMDYGNPAGVVIYKKGELSDNEMLGIAKDFGYSESAFIYKLEQNNYRIRFFSPTQEVDMCGHASLGSSYVINKFLNHDITEEISLIANEGNVDVRIINSNIYYLNLGRAQVLNQNYDSYQIARLLGIKKEEINGEIKLVDSGSKKLMIPIESFEVLKNIQPRFKDMISYCHESDVSGFYTFIKSHQQSNLYLARQFNPAAGINEDPVTGVAGAGLLQYLYTKDKNITSIEVEQVHFMGMKGKMFINFNKNKEILVGGKATRFDPAQC